MNTLDKPIILVAVSTNTEHYQVIFFNGFSGFQELLLDISNKKCIFVADKYYAFLLPGRQWAVIENDLLIAV